MAGADTSMEELRDRITDAARGRWKMEWTRAASRRLPNAPGAGTAALLVSSAYASYTKVNQQWSW